MKLPVASSPDPVIATPAPRMSIFIAVIVLIPDTFALQRTAHTKPHPQISSTRSPPYIHLSVNDIASSSNSALSVPPCRSSIGQRPHLDGRATVASRPCQYVKSFYALITVIPWICHSLKRVTRRHAVPAASRRAAETCNPFGTPLVPSLPRRIHLPKFEANLKCLPSH